MKKRKQQKRFSLGELIAVLFEESKKLTSSKVEQRLLVSAALKDLLRKQIHSIHPITIHS